MQLMIRSSMMALILASCAFANIDPHIIYATGGDAMPIGANGISINLSNGGGGIFVFQNTLGDLSNLDVKVQFPFEFFPNGFTLDETTFIPSAGQQSTFSSAQFNHVTCADLNGFSSSTACLTMKFGLVPGPLVGAGQNFVLDFDFPLVNGVDTLVLHGQYNAENCGENCTGTTDKGPNRNGDWPSDALVNVTPIPAVPEPRLYAGLLLSGLVLLLYRKQRAKTAR